MRSKASKSKPKRPHSQRSIDVWPIIETWSATILKLAVVGILISLGYLLYGVFSGALNGDASGQVPARIVNAVRIFGQVLTISSALATASLLLVTIEDIAFGIIAGVYGLILMLGTPFIISSNLRNPQSPAAEQLNDWGTLAGKLVIVLVALRFAYEIYRYVKEEPARRAARAEREERVAFRGEKKPVKRTRLLQHCWEMPFCHERIREICPAYKAHKDCWRFGRGCNCDPKLIESLIRMGGIGSAGPPRTSQQTRTEGEYIRSDLAADLAVDSGERTIPCSKCAIYAEHQRQKFRIVNPIAIIGSIVALAALYKPLTVLYSGLITTMAHLAANFSYGQTINPEQWFGQLDTPAVQIFFFIVVFLLALAYVLRFVEWAILVKKW